MNRLLKQFLRRPPMIIMATIGVNHYLHDQQSHQQIQSYIHQLVPQLALRKACLSAPDTNPFTDKWFESFVSLRPLFQRTDTGRYPEGPNRMIGSGFIMDKSGVVVTIADGLDNFSQLLVQLSDGREIVGKVIDINLVTNIAFLHLMSDRKDWPAVTCGDPKLLEVDNQVFAVGNPRLGVHNALTNGVITCAKRSGSLLMELKDKPEPLKRTDFIQHSADIKSSDTGTALVDGKGRVIGLNYLQYYVDLNLAIPINLIQDLTQRAVKELNDNMRQSYGLMIYWYEPSRMTDFTSSDYSLSGQLPNHPGALIWDLSPNSFANSVGLQRGHVITQVDEFMVTSIEDIYRAFNDKDVLSLTINNVHTVQIQKTNDNYYFV